MSYGTADYRSFFSNAAKEQEPMSYAIAAKRDPRWVETMDEEIIAMHLNRTWDIVERPVGKNVVSSGIQDEIQIRWFGREMKG